MTLNRPYVKTGKKRLFLYRKLQKELLPSADPQTNLTLDFENRDSGSWIGPYFIVFCEIIYSFVQSASKTDTRTTPKRCRERTITSVPSWAPSALGSSLVCSSVVRQKGRFNQIRFQKVETRMHTITHTFAFFVKVSFLLSHPYA